MKQLFMFFFLLLLPLASALADLPDIYEHPGEPDFAVPIPPPTPTVVDGGAGGAGGGFFGNTTNTSVDDVVILPDGRVVSREELLESTTVLSGADVAGLSDQKENSFNNSTTPTALTFLWAGLILLVILVFAILLFVRKRAHHNLPVEIKHFK